MSDTDRLNDLESRIAFQEDAIDKLSDVIARQEKELDQLKRMVLILSTQIRSFDAGDEAAKANEIPPHY